MEYYVHEFVKAYKPCIWQIVHCSLRKRCPKVNFLLFGNGERICFPHLVILMHYDGKGVRFGQ